MLNDILALMFKEHVVVEVSMSKDLDVERGRRGNVDAGRCRGMRMYCALCARPRRNMSL